MNWLWSFMIAVSSFHITKGENDCNIKCPESSQPLVCGLDQADKKYTMFTSPCAVLAYNKCYRREFVETPIEFCIKTHNRMLMSRKMYGESCPVFCPHHWRPVCGFSTIRGYRSFVNGCYLDMVNCRGGEYDDNYYTEIPLLFCPQHLMKNMYKEQVVVTGLRDDRDYD